MGDIQRWSEERSERKLDDLLIKVGCMCSNVELSMLADAFGSGLPQQNTATLIRALEEAGLSEENRPYHFVAALGGEDGLLAPEFLLALILGAARIKDEGLVDADEVMGALEVLGVPESPEIKAALTQAGVKLVNGKKWFEGWTVVDALIAAGGARALFARATKLPWRAIGRSAGRYARVGARLLFRK